MSQRNRREFLEDSMFAAAAAVTANGPPDLFSAEPQSASPNDRLGVAVVGVRGRGSSHIGAFATRRDTEILYLCDVDQEVGRKRVQEVSKRQRRQPQFVEDMRHILEDNRVDIVSIATPNHLHALQSIWAMQAGKDVYVETPASHNVSEGRRVVEASRKYHKLCQVGMQCRSNGGMLAAMQFLHAGHLGSVQIARGLCYQRRPAIGSGLQTPPPSAVNYDLWLGPAAVQPVARKQFHYDWHWQWPYGNGALGNQGLHQMDIASWGLNRNELSRRVLSYGGRFRCNDSGETANTQVVVHDFGDQAIIFEVRGLKSPDYRRAKIGVIFECSDGYLVMRSYDKGAAFDLDGNPVAEFGGGGDHFGSFVGAVRSRHFGELTADIELGHRSSALVHLGNISYRLGAATETSAARQIAEGFNAVEDHSQTFERTVAHLHSNRVDLTEDPIQMGIPLEFDPAAERFLSHDIANQLLTRSYRPPFVVPPADQV